MTIPVHPRRGRHLGGSRCAFALACFFAREDETPLTVLNSRGKVGRADGRHEAALDGLRAAYIPGCSLAVEYPVQTGDPAPTVLAAAAEQARDLLVVGTHGRTGLGRPRMVSVAEQVLHRALSRPVDQGRCPDAGTAAHDPVCQSGISAAPPGRS
jgi:nucleotide-binding universal stress UspA family protein